MISSGILAHVCPFLLGIAFCVGFTLWIQHVSVILCCVTALAEAFSGVQLLRHWIYLLIVFRYLTLVLIRCTHSLKLIHGNGKQEGLLVNGRGNRYLKIWAEGGLSVQGFASLPGPDPALPSGSQGSPHAGTHPVSPGCGMCSRKLTLLFFPGDNPFPWSLGVLGLPLPSWLWGHCQCKGTTPFPAGSLSPGARIRDLGWAGHRCWSSWRGEGSTGAGTHDTDPRNGWWLFFSCLLSLTRSSSGGQGELSSTTPHSGKRYEKYKNKEAYI